MTVEEVKMTLCTMHAHAGKLGDDFGYVAGQVRATDAATLLALLNRQSDDAPGAGVQSLLTAAMLELGRLHHALEMTRDALIARGRELTPPPQTQE